MTPKSLTLWYMRQQAVQESRATYCEQMGDLGGRDLAMAGAEIYANTVDALGMRLDGETLAEYERECSALQQEFRDDLLGFIDGEQVAQLSVNDCAYDSLNRLLAYSRAKTIANPGVRNITIRMVVNGARDSWSPSIDFMNRRNKILCEQ